MALIDIHGLGDVQVALDRHEALLNGGSITVPTGSDFVVTTNGVERGRITASGVFSGFADASKVPTISELTASVLTTTISANLSVPIFVAPFPCNVVACSIESWDNDVAADDANYWTVILRRVRSSSTSADIATKTTQATGGSAIAHRSDWNFDSVTFNASNQAFSKGDCAALAFTKTLGAPTAIGAGVLLQVRYEPT